MVAKLTYPVAVIGGHVAAQLPPIVRFMTKHNSVWSEALIMPLTLWNCVLSDKQKQKSYFSENLHVLQEITFITEFPGSNFLLPTFLAGGKWDFPVVNLLLAAVNFKP